MGAVYPLTEAHVLLTCAATGLIGGWLSVFNGAQKQLCSLAVSVPEIGELRRRIGGAALPFRLFLLA